MESNSQRPAPSSKDDNVASKVKRDAEAALSEATELGESAVETAKAKGEDGVRIIASQVDAVADAVRSAAASLDDDQKSGIADAVSGWAEGLGQFASNLRSRSADELLREAQTIARKQPAGFLLGSIAVGFALARFAKASSQHNADSDSYDGGARPDPRAPKTERARAASNRTNVGRAKPDPSAPSSAHSGPAPAAAQNSPLSHGESS